jgi:hypothetical protein
MTSAGEASTSNSVLPDTATLAKVSRATPQIGVTAMIPASRMALSLAPSSSPSVE